MPQLIDNLGAKGAKRSVKMWTTKRLKEYSRFQSGIFSFEYSGNQNIERLWQRTALFPFKNGKEPRSVGKSRQYC